MSIDPIFALSAAVTAIAGILVVTRRNPVYSAVWMLVCFLGLAALYLQLDAPFLAAMHVLVYTGAILVLFLFVIMLLNLKPEELGEEYPLRTRALAALLCAGLFVLLAAPMWQAARLLGPSAVVDAKTFGGVTHVGESLFKTYGFAFELMSVLILVAVFGGVALAKRKA